jgi:DNA-binding transcriptional LysR family regulator
MKDIVSNNDSLARATSPSRFADALDWNLLRSFVAIVEAGSITKAAERLGRGQPAVSLALQRLEAALGARLIARGGGSFELTASGRLLYSDCAELYGQVAQLKDLAADASAEISGQVAIHLASHVTTPLLDGLLQECHAQHPKIAFRLRSEASVAVAQAVRDKAASFGICLVGRRLAGLDYRLLYREFFGFFCGPSHPLFGQGAVTPEALRGLPAVGFETEALNDALRPVAALRQRLGLDQHIVGQSSNLEEVRRMIVCGLGIGALPLHVAEPERAAGQLWRLPPFEAPPAVDIFLVSNPAKRLNRAERLVLERLQAAIAQTPLAQRTYGANGAS